MASASPEAASNICRDLKLVTYEQIEIYINNCAGSNLHQLDLMRQVLAEMKKKGENLIKIPDAQLIPILIAYSVLIAFGAVGSFLVILVVAKNRVMRTPRNLFILNLAISDLILCCFTEPFNLLRLLSEQQEWILGNAMCRLTSMLQGMNILASTFSITAIALDRFYIIIHPEKRPSSNSTVIKILFLIWCLAIIISSPLALFSEVYQGHRKKCFEAPGPKGAWLRRPLRLAHSWLMLVLQYLVPMLILSVTYCRICIRIRYRMINQPGGRGSSGTGNSNSSSVVLLSENNRLKRQIEMRRQRRTNILLSCLAVIFALSWLPLNIANMVLDSRQNLFSERKPVNVVNFSGYSNVSANSTSPSQPRTSDSPSKEKNNNTMTYHFIMIQTICLLIALSSACANPVLYGWLNDNFKREFVYMFRQMTPARCGLRQRDDCRRATEEATRLMLRNKSCIVAVNDSRIAQIAASAKPRLPADNVGDQTPPPYNDKNLVINNRDVVATYNNCNNGAD